MTESKTQLQELIQSYLGRFPDDDELELFRAWFQNRYGQNLAAVIFFGSCLSERSRSESSFKDFIVVVDRYRSTSRNPIQWLSHWSLPPDLFHLELEGQGKKHECKYYLISRRQLEAAVGARAKDLYVMGRLSKRIALIFSRDEQSADAIALAQAEAMRNAARFALAFLDRFEPVAFIKAVMRLSYLAESRLEDDRKVESLFAAHRDFYERVYGQALAELVESGLVSRISDGKYQVNAGVLTLDRAGLDRFLIRSRKRAKARWPKMIITVDNWLDQLLGKLERTWGIRLDIPAWERPIILITGWRHYFRLKREGKIREHRASP